MRRKLAEVEKVLNTVDDLRNKGAVPPTHVDTAFNYLIEYTEMEGGFGSSLEGDRLLGLCLEVLHHFVRQNPAPSGVLPSSKRPPGRARGKKS